MLYKIIDDLVCGLSNEYLDFIQNKINVHHFVILNTIYLNTLLELKVTSLCLKYTARSDCTVTLSRLYNVDHHTFISSKLTISSFKQYWQWTKILKKFSRLRFKYKFQILDFEDVVQQKLVKDNTGSTKCLY